MVAESEMFAAEDLLDKKCTGALNDLSKFVMWAQEPNFKERRYGRGKSSCARVRKKYSSE
jgi:hypothetical protein